MNRLTDTIRDALLRVHSCRRTLHMARQVAMQEAMIGVPDLPSTDDLIAALAIECSHAEREAAILLRNGHTDGHGHHYGVRPNDRRSKVRPTFTFRRNTAGRLGGALAAQVRGGKDMIAVALVALALFGGFAMCPSGRELHHGSR